MVYFSQNSVYVSREPIFCSYWKSPREDVAELAKSLVLPAELSGKKSVDVSWKLTESKFSCVSHLSAECCRSKKGEKKKHRGIIREGPSYSCCVPQDDSTGKAYHLDGWKEK